MRRFNCIARVTFALAVAIFVGMEDEVLPADANYDEAKVPAYTLPDPLAMESGAKVTSPAQWPERRAELLRLFRDHVYGESPGRPEKMELETTAERPAGEGIPGTRREIAIKLTNNGLTHTIPVVMYVPTIGPGPYPIFVGMHLFDTKAETPVLGQSLKSHFEGEKKAKREPSETERAMLDKLPGEKMLAVLLASGYAVATLDAETTAPDDAKRWTEGIVKLFLAEGQAQPGHKEWGAIGVWAWSLSRALDYFQTDPQIDAKRVIAIGHSRMGKTALWAGAQDERFAIVISNNSGCGGAALSKRVFGETVKHINDRFPHWFCDEFQKYNDNESTLPVDQHELIALSAPRPVYVASAEEDEWADPLGEWLAVRAAEVVFTLHGERSIQFQTEALPKINTRCVGGITYHMRLGKHALSDLDWVLYLEHANYSFYEIPCLDGDFSSPFSKYMPRFIREMDSLIRAEGHVWRHGTDIVIRSHPFEYQIFADTYARGDFDVNHLDRTYTYQGSFRSNRFHFLWRELYGDWDGLFFDEASRQSISVRYAPLLSPDRKRFVGFVPNGSFGSRMRIWRVENEEIVEEWDRVESGCYFVTWHAEDVKWVSGSEIAFTCHHPPDGSEPKVTQESLRLDRDKWVCSVK